MAMFKAFKPSGMEKIARAMGYQGNMQGFQDYLAQDPMRQQQMQGYQQKAMQMANGGMVKSSSGYIPAGTGTTAEQARQNEIPRNASGIPLGGMTQSEMYKGFTGPSGNPMVVPKTQLKTIQDNLNKEMQSDPRYTAFQDYQKQIAQEQFKNPEFQKQFEQSQQYQDMQALQEEYENKLNKNIGDITVQRMTQPGLPQGGATVAAMTPMYSGQMLQQGTGAVGAMQPISTAIAGTQQADSVQDIQANKIDAVQVSPAVDTALASIQAAQTDENDPRSKVVAAQQTASMVGDLNAAQGTGILMDNPVQREIQEGELISGAANAEKAAKFTEEIQAAEATPSKQATVQGQLDELMQQFEGGNTPAWAASTMRAVKADLAKRGLTGSSVAGQALIQGMLESALPIAQADAKTIAGFEAQNLSNRQARAMLAAEQRAEFLGLEFDQEFKARVENASAIADIANQNFNADQQIALENSRIANTVNLQNLSNKQALVLAEASALSNMDLSNLNNRQQASVQNAQNFLQTDMANLSNEQQTELFKAQERIQSLFTDQAAENASRQFNATSQNQVDQFFANLASQTSQFNTSQSNAQAQFNAGQVNTVERFNQEIANQRDQFNAQNQLVIAQANAQWRRQIATADTAAVNRANEINAQAVLDISNQAYNNLWQHYADTMEWAWTSAESELDRRNALAKQQLENDGVIKQSEIDKAASNGKAVGNILTEFGTAIIGKWLP